MKTTLPLIALLAAGQAHAAYGSNLADRMSFGLTYSDVSRDVIEYDGFTLDARFKVVDTFAFRVSLTEARTGDLNSTVGVTNYAFALDARRFSVGGELTVPFTTSFLAFGLDFCTTTLDGTASNGLNTVSGELLDNTQVVVGARYVQEFGSTFSVGLGVSAYVNELSPRNGFQTVYSLDDDTTVAPSLTVAWSPVPSFTLQLAYSTEDTLLGIPDADGTVSLTARVNF